MNNWDKIFRPYRHSQKLRSSHIIVWPELIPIEWFRVKWLLKTVVNTLVLYHVRSVQFSTFWLRYTIQTILHKFIGFILFVSKYFGCWDLPVHVCSKCKLRVFSHTLFSFEVPIKTVLSWKRDWALRCCHLLFKPPDCKYLPLVVTEFFFSFNF